MIDLMADKLDESSFLAGDEVRAADFTAALGYFGLIAFGAISPSAHASIQRWSTAMMSRPSMAPLQQAAQFLQSATAPEEERIS
jgi:glutathione S-transferase